MTDTADLDALFAGYHIDDPEIRQLGRVTRRALKVLDTRLAAAKLDPHARRNFWQLLLPRDPAA